MFFPICLLVTKAMVVIKYLIPFLFFISHAQYNFTIDQLHKVGFKSPEGVELTPETCSPDYIRFLDLMRKEKYLSAKSRLYRAVKQPLRKLLNQLTYERNRATDAIKPKKRDNLKGQIRYVSQSIKYWESIQSFLIQPGLQEISLVTDYISKIRKGKMDDSFSIYTRNRLLAFENERLTFYAYNFSLKLCRAFLRSYRMTDYAYTKALELKKLEETRDSLGAKINFLGGKINFFDQVTQKNLTLDFSRRIDILDKEMNLLLLRLMTVNYKIKAIWDDFISNERGI